MMSKTGKTKRNSGFALVEVLISFLIIACGIVVCLQSLAQSLRVSRKLKDTDARIAQWEPVVFEMETGQRPSLTLEKLDPDFKNLL